MSPMASRTGSAALIVVLSALPLTACSSDGDDATAPTPTLGAASPSGPPGGLESYTDTGDGCAQAISAISYADDVLRPLGQEPFQEFDDVVRSRLAAVAGTLSLEAKDWPDEAVHQQAEIVQPLAQAAADLLPSQSAAAKAKRVTTLLRYRIEAGTLILACRDATPTATPS